MIEIQKFNVTNLFTNCYLLTDNITGDMAVVDPGEFSQRLIECIDNNNGKLKYVLLTHGHYDHIGFAKEIATKYNAKIICHKNTNKFLSDNHLNHSMYHVEIPDIVPFNADVLLDDGDVIKLGESNIKFIETPGHTDGCGCFIFDNCMITGDTIFCNSFGRTDLPTGSISKMLKTFKKLKGIKEDYIIYPGHGKTTTLAYEQENNPLMIRI